jgi:hypothetical protein
MKPICLAASALLFAVPALFFAVPALLFAVPALAQTPDPHAGHVMPDAATAPAPAMDHGAMPGMDHGNMDHGNMDHSKMDHGNMAMTPAPKGIARSSIGPAEAALQAFSDALEVGNRDLAIARLAPDVRVIENGVEENRADYIAAHLAADIAYQKGVRVILLERVVSSEGPTRAQIKSRLRMVGNRSDTAIDARVDETAVLAKWPDGWKITRIEWVSVK